METDHSTNVTVANFYREYLSWRNLRNRCLKPTDPAYKNYGGRGITVCDRWLGKFGFKNFVADMGRKPTPKHSIDRIDNDKGYSQENCQWSTAKIQAENRRRTRWFTLNGERKTMAAWAKFFGITPAAFCARINHGWEFIEAATTVTRPPRRTATHDGQTKTLVEWSRITGVKTTTMRMRLAHGWPESRAITEPEAHRNKQLTINGESLIIREWCRRAKISRATLLQRIRLGRTLEKAVTEPIKKTWGRQCQLNHSPPNSPSAGSLAVTATATSASP